MFRFQIGGRIQNDWAFMDEERDVKKAVGDLEDGTEFRRVWMSVAGLLYGRVEFKGQFDFDGGDVVFRDVYLGLVGLPLLDGIRVGHFKEPFGLEALASNTDTTFMERGLPIAFVPLWNTGVGLHNHFAGERATLALGLFRDTDAFGDGQSEGRYTLTVRLTGLPWHGDGGRRLLHVGAAYRHLDPREHRSGSGNGRRPTSRPFSWIRR
jgi:phosphate-selective porin OprO/OprP